MTRIAITRAVSRSLARCELSHLERQPIDVARARVQHAAYETLLVTLGCELRRLDEAPGLPDAVFVEDTVVVLDELAVITRPGAASRRDETRAVAAALAPLRALVSIGPPGILDGGDVLRIGRTLWVGRGERSDDAGIAQLAARVEPYGYRVRVTAVRDCLHLKSAVTEVADGVLLVQPRWLAADALDRSLERIAVAADEPFAANALRIGDTLVYPSAFPATRRRLERRGLDVRVVDVSELARAEGAVTCCSLIVAGPPIPAGGTVPDAG